MVLAPVGGAVGANISLLFSHVNKPADILWQNKSPACAGLLEKQMKTNNQGLFYRRGDGSKVSMSEESEQWLVTLRPGGGVYLRRFVDGRIDESYREMDDAEGAVAILGAILGFEPPRCPIRRDRRAR